MVRSCKIVTERLAAVLTDEDCTCVAHLCHDLKRIRCHDLQMLGCNRIYCINRIGHIVSQQDKTVLIQRLLNDLRSGKLL